MERNYLSLRIRLIQLVHNYLIGKNDGNMFLKYVFVSNSCLRISVEKRNVCHFDMTLSGDHVDKLELD